MIVEKCQIKICIKIKSRNTRTKWRSSMLQNSQIKKQNTRKIFKSNKIISINTEYA